MIMLAKERDLRRVSDSLVGMIIETHEQQEALADITLQCTSALAQSKNLINTLLQEEKLTQSTLDKIESVVIVLELQLSSVEKRKQELITTLQSLHKKLDIALDEEHRYTELLMLHPAELN